jgi:hypothetical protein
VRKVTPVWKEATKMRILVATLLIGMLAAVSAADQNPNIHIYLDADPPNHLDRIDPVASSTFEVYVCLDCFNSCAGTRGTAFLLQRTFGGYKLSQTALLGGLDFGDAETDPGWTIAAGADCVYPDQYGVVCVGVVTYLYLGTPGTLDVLPHGLVEPGTGREVLDCCFLSDFYCISGNLGVGMDPNPPEPGCECDYWLNPPPAGQNPNVGIALHVDYDGHDCSYFLPDCNLISTAAPFDGGPKDFIVMVCFHENGFCGAQYTLEWPEGWQFVNWQSCAWYDADPFSGVSGDFTYQTWIDCQPPGFPTTIGILTLVPTSPGRVRVWYDMDTGAPTGVWDCAVHEVNGCMVQGFDHILPYPEIGGIGNGRAGYVEVGGGQGCNPCFCVGPPCWPEEPNPVEDSTWGKIKGMYR